MELATIPLHTGDNVAPDYLKPSSYIHKGDTLGFVAVNGYPMYLFLGKITDLGSNVFFSCGLGFAI